MTIKPPFANYHPAELERLVREGFETIEQRAATLRRSGYPWPQGEAGFISAAEFQVLVAADAYLRAKKETQQ